MGKNVIEGFRLSPLQKQLWISSSTALHVQIALLFQGEVEPSRLKEAAERITRDHTIFRTTLYQQSGLKIPLQVIAEQLVPEWSEVNGATWPQEEWEQHATDMLMELRARPFDLEDGPLLRLFLIRLRAQACLLLIDASSFVADMSTLQNFRHLLCRHYEEPDWEEDGEEIPQYLQFSEWLYEVLADPDSTEGRNYWREKRAFPPPRLPFEQKKGAGGQGSIAVHPVSIFPSTATLLRERAQREGPSLSTLLLGCWQALLWRVSGQPTISVGCLHDERIEEVRSSMGLFASYLPLQTRFSSRTSLSEVLQTLEHEWQQALAWQEFFLDDDEEQTSTDRQEICFDYYDWPASIRVTPELTCRTLAQHSCINRFKLKLSCYTKNQNIYSELQYDPEIYSSKSISILANQFQVLLEQACTHLETPISQLSMLSEVERQFLFHASQGDEVNSPSSSLCVHHLFERQAKQTPHLCAVRSGAQHITYQELDEQSAQLAHHLQAAGIGPESVVGLCIERSLDMIIGMLGILKAGGAYLPLDPHWPKEYGKTFLEDSQAQAVLTQRQLLPFLPSHAQILCLEDFLALPSPGKGTPHQTVTPDNLAYFLFTSGSTGKPKAVAIAHRQLTSYIKSISQQLSLPVGASYAFISSFTADLGNTVIYPSLCNGGCLHIISEDMLTDPEALANYCETSTIDCLKIVPFHLQALLQSSRPQALLPKQRLVLGGEMLSWALIQQVHALAPECLIFNHYGPTESTVGVLTYRVEQEEESPTVPLGHPLNHASVYLVDNYLQISPTGVIGEICIGGNGLARGYLNDPRLTAERFLPDPFSRTPGSRLYRTGDLARYRPDATIEFVGRADQQVKVRGFRIELGSIAAQLVQHPDVHEAVVVAREIDTTGVQKRLAAYVVLHAGKRSTGSDLRAYLKHALPEYMVPTDIVFLKHLPLTTNGKIDYQKLPPPEQLKEAPERPFLAPRTPMEHILADIWSEVLGRGPVSMDDGFFALGGDSILCIQVVAKASQVGVQMTPKQLFQYQTIAELVEVVTTGPVLVGEQGLVTGEVPLTPIQHWFFEQAYAEPHHFNQAVLLGLNAIPNPTLFAEAFELLLNHHDALRMRFRQDTDGWHQWNAGVEEHAYFSVSDLSALSKEKQIESIEAHARTAQASLHLTDGPLLHVTLFIGTQHHPAYLLVLIHHLVIDGVSWRFLLEDLEHTYTRLNHGQAPELPAKTTSFKQWAESLSEYAQKEPVQRELLYWLSLHAQTPPALPIDTPGGRNTAEVSRTLTVVLETTATEALLHEVHHAYQTEINDILLAALLLSFHRWTGERNLLVELEGHGREDIIQEISITRTVGWFTTHFPLRLMVGMEAIHDPASAIKEVKEQVRAIPQHGIGYGILRYVSKDREIVESMKTLPAADVRFNYLGQFDQLIQASSLFAPTTISPGPDRSPQGKRSHLIEINGFVAERRLHMQWTYSQELHQESTIQKLGTCFLDSLQTLIEHCLSTNAGGYTPSDFSAAKLSQAQLDRFIARLGAQGGTWE